MTSSTLPTDRELLARFVKTGDGAAFAVLTERHLGLVFGTACRRAGSREMAQEAAQNTFCQLARNAARIRVPASGLGPWLHAVALREAGTLLRAEAAQRRARERMAMMAGAHESAAPAPPGSEHLDGALAALPEDARRVLILRYLQGLSLREIALAEDTSEEAARKRVARALDRLTRSLARRGVTAAGVTACLAAALVSWPAPSSAAALAGRAVRQAAASTAGAGAGGLAGLALSQWPLAVVFLLTAGPAAVWPRAAEARAVNGKPAGPPARAASAAATPGTGRPPGETAAPPAGVVSALGRELMRMGEAPWSQRNVEVSAGNRGYRQTFDEFKMDSARLAAIRRAVLDFSLEEVRAAAALPDGPGKYWILSPLYARWAELAPEEAREAALTAKRSQTALSGMVRAWAAAGQTGDLAWAYQHVPEEVRAALEPLRGEDPERYLRLTASLDPEADSAAVNKRYMDIAPYDPLLALEGLRENEKRGELARHAFELGDLADTGVLRPELAETLADYAASLPEDSALRVECLRAAALLRRGSEPERAAEWRAASRTAGDDADWMNDMCWMLKEWRDTDPAAPARWLAEGSGLDPDTVTRLTRSAGLTPPAAADSAPLPSVATP